MTRTPSSAVAPLLALALGCAPAAEDAPAAPARPTRIVSATLATDEILAALVPPERVVMVTAFSDDPETSHVAGHYPPEIPRIEHLALEPILATDPDLVLVASFSSRDVLDILRESDLPVHVDAGYDSFAGVRANVLELGALVGEPERAAAVVAEMDARLAAVEARLARVRERPRVLYWAVGWTAGARTTIGETIERAGGTNVGAELGLEGMVRLPDERVLAADPDVLLLNTFMMGLQPGRDELPESIRDLRAVRAGRVIALDAKHLTTVSHHLADAVEALAPLLHPELFSDEAAARR